MIEGLIAASPLIALVVGVHLLTKVDRRGIVKDMRRTTADRQAARRRQELRRSNAAVPIPRGDRKRPRSRAKQELREDTR